MSHMLQKSSMSSVLACFFESPLREFSLKDICQMIGIAHTSVKKNLIVLVKEKLVIESHQKKGSRKFPLYKANMSNPLFIQHKKMYNLSSILESGIVLYIHNKLSPRCIVLFGSYQRGEDVEDSDIDVFLECRKEILDLRHFEKRLKRTIQIHFSSNFLSFPDELKNNIVNGSVLAGYLEAYR